MEEIVIGALVCEGRVLLVHRSPSRSAYPGVWDLPGGHVEAGESELDALSRELHEELGVHIAVDSTVHLCRWEAGASASVLFSAWLVGKWQRTPANVASDEHDDLRWFSPRDLPPLVHDHLRTILVAAVHHT